MKKRYLFMSSFFIIGTVFTLIYFLSYRSYDRGQEEVVKQESHPVDTVKEIRVNSSMKYVVENYDGTTGVVTTEEGTVPAKIAGKTRRNWRVISRNITGSCRRRRFRKRQIVWS